MKLLRTLAIAAAISAAALCCQAQQMPVRTIGDKQYYTYTVRSGDTLYGLQSRLGITREELLRHNPSAADGLTPGAILIFPIDGPRTSAATVQRYTVKGNETIFGIAKKLGVKPEDIVALNPQANEGVRKGMTLLIPGVEIPAAESASAAASETPAVAAAEPQREPAKNADAFPAKEPEALAMAEQALHADYTAPLPAAEQKPELKPELKPEQKPEQKPTAAAAAAAAAQEKPQDQAAPQGRLVRDLPAPLEQVSVTQPAATDSIRVVVALPLMSADDKLSRSASVYNEFVRGFLLAAAALNGPGERPVSVKLHDTSIVAPEAVVMQAADAVIAPESDTAMAQALRMAGPQTQVLNIFNVRDESYAAEPRMYQTNINQPLMYDKAIAWLLESNPGYTVVVLDREGSKAEKMPFVNALRESLAVEGVPVINVSYSGRLDDDDLQVLAPNGRYLFVPTSGAMADLNLFAPAIQKLREADAEPDRLRTFGYPDWIAFRGEPQALLHQLEASYYSRYAYTDDQPEATDVLDQYSRWFGAPAAESFPSPALLGYDTAIYIIKGVRSAGSMPQLMQQTEPQVGIQSVFAPARVGDNGGYVNAALFGIRCNKDYTTSSSRI